MKRFITALQFLTRISIKQSLFATAEEIGQSTVMYPLVGFVIGLILCGLFLLLRIWPVFSPFVAGAAVLAIEVAVTGGLHLDGFMDSADGFMSYRPRERVLEIMKDSNVGASAVIWIFCLLFLKTGLISSIDAAGVAGPMLLVMMPVMGRWVALYVCSLGSHADPESKGLGRAVIDRTGRRELVSGLVVTLTLVWFSAALLWAFGAYPSFILKIILILFALLLAATLTGMAILRISYRRIGGITGDVVGASVEITELVVLALGIILVNVVI